VIGRKDLWRRGFGGDAARVRTAYAFDVLGLRLLLSEAFVDNQSSQRMLARVGYREVGRIPARYFKRGAFRDVVLFACHHDWWAVREYGGGDAVGRPGGALSRGPRFGFSGVSWCHHRVPGRLSPPAVWGFRRRSPSPTQIFGWIAALRRCQRRLGGRHQHRAAGGDPGRDEP
jgi:hypothetical protein